MAKIDLATYLATIKLDATGLKTGLKEADEGVKSGIEGLGSWTNLKMAGIMAGIGATIVKISKESVKAFASTEEEMNKVFTMLPKKSDEAKREMTQQARDLALEVGKLPEEVIPAIYDALSAGVPEDNVFDFVEVASKGAVAGGAETSEMVEGLASVINAYGMEADQAENISDMFFVTLKNGMTSIPELSHSLSQVTPIASAMGVEFEEVAGAMATMTAQGIPTSTAANQIKVMLAELGKEGTKSSEIFESISGKTFPEFIEQGGEFNEALALMEQYASDNNLSMMDMFGSVQAGQGALALTGENMASFTEDIDAMKESAGATEDAFGEMNQGINRTKEIIEVMVNDILISIGEILAPFLSIFYTAVMGALALLKPAIELIAEVVEIVVEAVTERIEKIKKTVEDFAEDNADTLESIATTIKSITEKIKKIVELVVDKISDILDIFHDSTEDGAKTTWEAIADIIDTVLKVIEGILDIYIAIFSGDWESLWDTFKDLAKLAWNAIKTIVKGSLKAIIGILKGMFKTFFNVGKELFNNIWEAAKGIFGDMIMWLPNKIKELISAFTGSYGEARSAGKGMFSSVWEGMKGIWGSISSWVSSKVSWLTNKLAFWRRGQSEMSSGGGRGSADSFATGTRLIKQDGLNMLHAGEAVIPAALNPFNPKNINKGGFYNDKFALAGAGGGNANYQVDINIDRVDSGIDIERAVENGIQRAEKQRVSRLKRKGI